MLLSLVINVCHHFATQILVTSFCLKFLYQIFDNRHCLNRCQKYCHKSLSKKIVTNLRHDSWLTNFCNIYFFKKCSHQITSQSFHTTSNDARWSGNIWTNLVYAFALTVTELKWKSHDWKWTIKMKSDENEISCKMIVVDWGLIEYFRVCSHLDVAPCTHTAIAHTLTLSVRTFCIVSDHTSTNTHRIACATLL